MSYDNSPTMAGVYKITHRDSGRCYVGSSSDVCSRWAEHRQLRSPQCRIIHAALKKYGPEAFDFSILETVDASGLSSSQLRKQLLELETFWLQKVNPFPPHGYNICFAAGSRLGIRHTEETKRNLSLILSGKRQSEEARLRRRESKKIQEVQKRATEAARVVNFGNKFALGHHHSEEFRERQRANRTGKTWPAEVRQKIGLSHIGRHHSLETRRKISEAHQRRWHTNGSALTAASPTGLPATGKA